MKKKYVLVHQEFLCLAKDTPIYGSNIPIQEVKPNNKILGLNGEEQRVLKVFKRYYEGELVTIKVMGCLPVTMTPEHLVLTIPSESKYVKKGNKFIRTRIFGEPIWKFAKDVKPKVDYVIVPRRKNKEENFIKLRVGRKKYNGWADNRRPIKIKIDEEVAEILGLYVAEGFTRILPKRRIYETVFCLGGSEENLAKRLAKLIKEKLHVNTSIYKRKKRSEIIVKAYSKDLATFLKQEFGKGAKNKFVSEKIKNAEINVIKGFIKGVFEGDGSYCEGKPAHITTAVSYTHLTLPTTPYV